MMRTSATSLPMGSCSQLETNERKSLISSTSLQIYKRFDYVGIFLKMCTDMSVAGIDLFSPTDVVDKKNTRKVCMCIRSLSVKARLRGLKVPDFDNLTRPSVNGSSHTPQSNYSFNMVVAEFSQETSVMTEDHRHLDASNNGEIINTTDDGVMNSLSTTPDDHQPGADSPQSIEYIAHERPEGIKKGNTEDRKQDGTSRFADQSGLFGRLLHDNNTLVSTEIDCSVARYDEAYDPSRMSLDDTEEHLHNNGNTEHIKREGAPEEMPQRNWWKLVVKGTALLCVAVIVLHPRKSRQENVTQVRKQPNEVPKQSTAAPLSDSEKGQKSGTTSGLYPAEKLRFGF